jgi:hypothetical protein
LDGDEEIAQIQARLKELIVWTLSPS